MNMTLGKDEIGLLLLIHRLHQSHRPLGREAIVPLAEIKLPAVARTYAQLVQALQAKGLLHGNPEAFSLTLEGENTLDSLSQQHSLHAWFYNEYYQAIQNSRAHALFCERAYGKNLGQHGLADMTQIDILLNELDIQPSMSLLDFGCGDGRISEYVSDVTQAVVSGVDIARKAIELARERTQAKRDRLHFYWADMERKQGTWPPGHFDRVIAIDSIFFASDQHAIIQVLLDALKPGGRMGVFYLCPGDVSAEQTTLGKALQALSVQYKARDLSEPSVQHCRRKKHVLLELEAMFYEEGNEFLFKNRLADCDSPEHFHRYLFTVHMQ